MTKQTDIKLCFTVLICYLKLYWFPWILINHKRSDIYLTCLAIKTLTFLGIRALAVPFLLPKPQWRPFLLASVFFRTLALEWTATGFLIISPSLMSFLMFWPKTLTKMNTSSDIKEYSYWNILYQLLDLYKHNKIPFWFIESGRIKAKLPKNSLGWEVTN